jgi:hypothetical protein
VEAIQNHFRVVNQSLDNICLREREAIASRATFQEAVVSLAREGVPMVFGLSVSEQARGDIILKTWEANIAEGKKMAKEVKEACEEDFQLLNKESLGLRKDDSSEILDKLI